MPRIQLYLPDDLYLEVKRKKLKASELLQEAVRAEVRRQDLLSNTDQYLKELIAEVGEPSLEDIAAARALSGAIKRPRSKRAG